MPRRVSLSPHRGRFTPYGPFAIPALSSGLRRVRVFTPQGSRDRARPALLMFDGQNVFDDHGSFAGGWHLHASVEKLSARGKGPAPIVVAIDHGGPSRIDELSPFHDGRHGGKLDALLGWMVDDLVPRLQRDFGVLGPPHGFCLGGSSMGGLAALYGHLARPATFGGAIAMSPSLWFANRRIFEFADAHPKPWTSRIYLDCGAKEGRMLPVVQAMATHLAARGWSNDQLMFFADPRGAHTEAAWRRRMPRALRFMYR